MQLLDRLGIDAQVRPRMQYFPNGYAAMRWLAESRGTREMGITQATEILANPGVTYVGPLPGDLGLRTVYAAGLAARAQNPGGASEFITRLTAPSARAILAQAGYEFEE
jgi:molybdate transport system substrate-binding protein